MYTTAVFVWFQRKLDKLATNHLQHLVRQEVKKQMGEQSRPLGTEPESSPPE